MNIIKVTFTKNNIYYNISSNTGHLARSLGVFGIYNSYKRFPNAFDEITGKLIPDLSKIVDKVLPIQVIFNGYRFGARLYLISFLLKHGYHIGSIIDHTTYKYNGCKLNKARRV